MKKLFAAVIFLAVFTIGAASASAAANVVTLMYHSVTQDANRLGDYTVSPEQLDSDIQYFMSQGYIPITASELVNENYENVNNRKILLLTFDDGYDNFYMEVFPILKKYNAKATMFLIGSYINRYGYLTEDQVYEMAHSGLVEIGNHTDSIHHTPVNQLYDIYNNPNTMIEVVEDIRRNGIVLKNITGYDVTSLSWPYGYYTTALDNAVKNQLGYRITFSTKYGVNFFTGDASAPFNRMNRESSATTWQVFERANNKISGK